MLCKKKCRSTGQHQ